MDDEERFDNIEVDDSDSSDDRETVGDEEEPDDDDEISPPWSLLLLLLQPLSSCRPFSTATKLLRFIDARPLQLSSWPRLRKLAWNLCSAISAPSYAN